MPATRGSHAAHLAVAAVSGLAVTLLEFAAVRFMAPSFGQSSYVWANVIGVILLALALGYWSGGRLADRSRSGRPLYTAYVVAAAYITAIAFLGGALCEWLVPRGIGADRHLPLAFTGSLVATLALFGPPTLVLGMTSPFLIRLDDRPDHAGRISGRIFALGTLGSLVGCYLGPLWLFAAIGTRASILLAAGMLAFLGLAGLLLGKRPTRSGATAAALVTLAALGLGGWAAATDLPLRSVPGQLEEVESAYQSVRVVEADAVIMRPHDDGWALYGEEAPVRTRFLQHDEDHHSYQSVWLPDDADTLLTGGRYYDHLALGAYFDRPEPPERLRVLIVGYAGGALHRVLRLSAPAGTELELLGVEIDPAVVDVGRTWLATGDLENSHTRIVAGEDARTVVNALPSDVRFDLVYIDAYAQTTFVPFQVATFEFFRKVAAHLAEDGWIGINLHAVGGRGLDAPLVRSLATTLAEAPGIGDAWLVPNPLFPGSVVLWAAAPGVGPPRLSADTDLPLGLRDPAFALERLLVGHDPERDGGHLFTDDHSDVDRMTLDALGGP